MIPAARRIITFALAAVLLLAGAAHAQPPAAKIALHTSLTGPSRFAGQALLDAVRFAIDEANAAGASPRFELGVYDDTSTEAGAVSVARQIAASDALVAIGPATSPLALAACPTYAAEGVVAIDATVHADAVTNHATTFRIVVSTGEIGMAQADYLGHVLHAKQAIVLYRDNGYGQPLAAGFKRIAESLGVVAAAHGFSNPSQRDGAVRLALADPDQPPLVLGMTFEDAVPVMIALRRGGYRGLLFGTATMARASFADLFSGEPEERRQHGFFTDGAYAVSPMILDSANAETLAFADRFQTRFGREPSWETVQGYDAAQLAMQAVRAALGAGDTAKARAAVRSYLLSLNSPAHALQGLTGPLWFSPDRIRAQAVRVGTFRHGLFESAPLQLVPVPHPDPADLASGAVFALDTGRFARLQRVVSTGVFVNEITHIDIAKSSFGADFYFWERYAREGGPDSADPTDVMFDNQLGGRFDGTHPMEDHELADATIYRLWRVQGEFRNDFDLHRFPFDRQTLSLRFFNRRAATDRVVYVLDRRSAALGRINLSPTGQTSEGTMTAAAAPAPVASATPPIASPVAFHNLTQWTAQSAEEGRDNLVTRSALGDLRRMGSEADRELSGYLVAIDVQRRALATVSKTLLPVLLMTAIMFASLYFPVALVKEKITVAITAALTGSVLLAAINSQLGGIGYTIAVEYAFYLFFALSLLCIVSVLLAERLRVARRGETAAAIERWTRLSFLLAVAIAVAAGGGLLLSPA